jgi:cell division cycle 2-like
MNSLNSVTLVMEFLEHDLKVLQDDMKGPFLAPEVKCLVKQLLQGVNYLHANWVLHRDLKTANLLLNNQGILKIGDFGLAREYGSPQKRLSANVVTLWYRAPELLLEDKDYTPAIDMWSVGCIFAELLTQTPLFDGKGELEQITKIFTTLGTPTEETWPGVSQLNAMKQFTWRMHVGTGLREKLPIITNATFDLISRMLTLDPKQRITAEEALRHRYFQEDPPPQIPSMMPTFPSRAEGG